MLLKTSHRSQNQLFTPVTFLIALFFQARNFFLIDKRIFIFLFSRRITNVQKQPCKRHFPIWVWSTSQLSHKSSAFEDFMKIIRKICSKYYPYSHAQFIIKKTTHKYHSMSFISSSNSKNTIK